MSATDVRRPNILLIMADQLRRDALGVYGSWAGTPHIDELARSSTIFDRAVTVSPACQPARLSLAMGQYPHNFGLWSNGPGFVPAGAPTWMSAIRDAGYDTSTFGKLHLGRLGKDLRENEDHAVSIGFDTVNEALDPRGCFAKMSHMTQAWADAGLLEAFRDDHADRLANAPLEARPSMLPLDLYYDVYVPSRAIDHIAALPADRPWFCNLSFPGPHEPWDAPEPYASMYAPEDAPTPVPVATDAEPAAPSYLDKMLRGVAHRDRAVIAGLQANYAGSVRLIDDQIGRVLELIRERGEWEHTVIAITSDHGEMNGDHGRVYKGNFYQSAVSVPLIIRIPGVTRGERSAALVELHDVGPTLAELAAAPLVVEQFAQSLVPSCHDPTAPARAVHISEYKRDYMVSDGRYRLVVNRDAESVVLHDLQQDPGEQHNVLTGHRDVELELREGLFRAITWAQLTAKRPGNVRAFRLQKAEAQARLASDQPSGVTE